MCLFILIRVERVEKSKLVQDMEPVAIPKHVKDDLDATLKSNVDSQFLGGVGQLQWLQSQANPLLSICHLSCKAGQLLPTVMIS